MESGLDLPVFHGRDMLGLMLGCSTFHSRMDYLHLELISSGGFMCAMDTAIIPGRDDFPA